MRQNGSLGGLSPKLRIPMRGYELFGFQQSDRRGSVTHPHEGLWARISDDVCMSY